MHIVFRIQQSTRWLYLFYFSYEEFNRKAQSFSAGLKIRLSISPWKANPTVDACTYKGSESKRKTQASSTLKVILSHCEVHRNTPVMVLQIPSIEQICKRKETALVPDWAFRFKKHVVKWERLAVDINGVLIAALLSTLQVSQHCLGDIVSKF